MEPHLPSPELGLPAWEPVAHFTRSCAPAPLALLFAPGHPYHECIWYHILTDKSLCCHIKTLGFAGLCATHHMTTNDVTKFASLCTSLLQVDDPSALSVLNPSTGELLQHCQLRHDPHYKTTWDTLYANELGCLCQGIGSGDAPGAKWVVETNTFFLINYQDIPFH